MLDAGGFGSSILFEDRDGVAIGGKRVVDAAAPACASAMPWWLAAILSDLRACSNGTGSDLLRMGGEALAEHNDRLIPALEPVQQKSNLVARDRKPRRRTRSRESIATRRPEAAAASEQATSASTPPYAEARDRCAGVDHRLCCHSTLDGSESRAAARSPARGDVPPVPPRAGRRPIARHQPCCGDHQRMPIVSRRVLAAISLRIASALPKASIASAWLRAARSKSPIRSERFDRPASGRLAGRRQRAVPDRLAAAIEGERCRADPRPSPRRRRGSD